MHQSTQRVAALRDCSCGSEQRPTAARLLWEYKHEQMWTCVRRVLELGAGGCEERNIWICSGWTEEERVMVCHETPRKETTVERSGSCPTTQTGGVDKL